MGKTYGHFVSQIGYIILIK